MKKMEGGEGAFTLICLFSPFISVFLSFRGCNSFFSYVLVSFLGLRCNQDLFV